MISYPILLKEASKNLLSRGSAAPEVLLITELYPPAVGGSASLFEGIYSRLTSRRVSVLVDCEASPRPSPDLREDPRVVSRHIATRQWGISNIHGLLHHLYVATEIRALGSNNDTIAHVGRALPEGIAAWAARRFGGPRYVCWAHGEDIATASSSRELTFVMRRVYRGAAAVFANSHSTAALLHALGIARDSIHVVYPGVDPSRFHPDVDGSDVRRRLAPNGELILLSVGRLQRRKGHDLAITALAESGMRERAVRYVIVGGGDERAALESLARTHGVRDRVTFAGEVSDADLPAYYAACDIFVLPNRVDDRDVEGFGIVFLEAAATGKPVIGGRSGGVPEAVADAVTGTLVGGTDPAELAAAIGQLADNPMLRATMGRAGRARIVSTFTWNHAVSTVAGIDAALRRSRGASA